MVYICENAMTDFPIGENIEITVEDDGYARWYTVNSDDAGKTITVNIPENSSFALYENDICIYFSVHGNRPVILPKWENCFYRRSAGCWFCDQRKRVVKESIII